MISAPAITVADLPKDLTYPPTTSKLLTPVSLGGAVINSLSDTADQQVHQAPSSAVNWEHQLGVLAKKMLEDGRENVFQDLLNKFEKSVIGAALETTRGRKVEAAERLGIGRNTITRKLQELGIE
jgi:two-component system nitrogen regulation response regulator GlnG